MMTNDTPYPEEVKTAGLERALTIQKMIDVDKGNAVKVLLNVAQALSAASMFQFQFNAIRATRMPRLLKAMHLRQVYIDAFWYAEYRKSSDSDAR